MWVGTRAVLDHSALERRDEYCESAEELGEERGVLFSA